MILSPLLPPSPGLWVWTFFGFGSFKGLFFFFKKAFVWVVRLEVYGVASAADFTSIMYLFLFIWVVHMISSQLVSRLVAF